MRVFIALLTGALFIFPILAQAQSPLPQETATVSVPDGWNVASGRSDMGASTIANVWRAPAPREETISLEYADNASSATLQTIVSTTRSKLYGMFAKVGGKLLTDHAEKVCGGSVDAWFFEIPFPHGSSRSISEQVIVVGKQRVFTAAYLRPAAGVEDAAARKALDTLCVKA